MKILKLLNKTYLSILIILFFSTMNSFSENEPVDIWNIDKEQIQENSENKESISITESELETEKIDVFNMQTKDRSDLINFKLRHICVFSIKETYEIEEKFSFCRNDGLWKEHYWLYDIKKTKS